MAATPSSTRRPPNTRGSSTRKVGQNASAASRAPNSEPPLKKRRYVPGGPGGGGRYIDSDGNETPVGGGGPGGYNYVGPRGRVGRENAASGAQPVNYSPRPRRESRRERPSARPRFSSAAAAAAAAVHGDGFKPREERGWEEFHQDLDIEARFPVFSSYEVDGVKKPIPTSSFNTPEANGPGRMTWEEDDTVKAHSATKRTPSAHDDTNHSTPMDTEAKIRRRSSRPIRRTDSMLKGIGTPDVPKVVPVPGFNPREKLTLPKPSFRRVDPFEKFEEKGINRVNYVDKTMANIGYQESEIYLRPDNNLIRVTEGNIEDDLDIIHSRKSDNEANAAGGASSFGRVEYDMDEQDTHWLEVINEQRHAEQFQSIKPAIFEATMTKIEKEWYALEKRIPKPNPKPPQTQRPRSSSAAAVNGELAAPGEEQDSKCAICDDGDCENTNAIVFCDGCDLAVHQECYGVPFIPEGQWLCRKCQLIGRGRPTCIFCPNPDGAFKQTNASRWSHLLCAIWIPEVSIGNTTFMEPVMDVEKVPKPRWKLTCYICRQKMGACIQCGNKNCYIAFHVTCARRARLFLKMKSAHGGPASLDANVLKAFCDKHVPTDWRREQDVDSAIVEAMDHYRRTMRGTIWADSQQSALTIMPAPSQDPEISELAEDPGNTKITLKFNANGRNKNQPPKIVWRLPSGAPVIPQIVYNSVEVALGRSAISKRKEFAADMCKYWTLKREARRGAALLKRLQLQMETFTSTEITRRNFVGMGAAGGVRLQRRINFADSLLEDVDKLRQICAQVQEREQQKLEDALLLRSVVDTVYFPIAPLLRPILQRARSLDGKNVFETTFASVYEKLCKRVYTSVQDFSKDLLSVLNEALSLPQPNDANDTGLANGESHHTAPLHDFKPKKALAKRIMKAVQGALEGALAKENELLGKPAGTAISSLNTQIEENTARVHRIVSGIVGAATMANGITTDDDPASIQQLDSRDSDIDPAIAQLARGSRSAHTKSAKKSARRLTPDSNPLTNGNDHMDEDEHDTDNNNNHHHHHRTDLINISKDEPPTPPSSAGGDARSLSAGGIPWYLEGFDPDGTTVYEERWVGREGAQSLSDDLSDMDEEELSGLVDNKEMGLEATATTAATTTTANTTTNVNGNGKKMQRDQAAQTAATAAAAGANKITAKKSKAALKRRKRLR